ncbi:MAG: hypothetical protein KIT09_15455 [Bryobacteraceae bacterium]|nr:hypothetical protein [Bryobacteraceae bacterium]
MKSERQLEYNSDEQDGSDAVVFRLRNAKIMTDTSLLGVKNMDVQKMLADLRQEREQIEEAILTLERLARGRGRRRGRPPAWMTAAKKRIKTPDVKKAAATSKTAAT